MPCVLQIHRTANRYSWRKTTFFVDSQPYGSDMANFGDFEKKGKNAFFSFFLTTFSLECSNSTDYITYPTLEDTFSEGY